MLRCSPIIFCMSSDFAATIRTSRSTALSDCSARPFSAQCIAVFHSACILRLECRPIFTAVSTILVIASFMLEHACCLESSFRACCSSGSMCAGTCMCCKCVFCARFCHGHTHPLPYGMRTSSLGCIVLVAMIDIYGLPVFLHTV